MAATETNLVEIAVNGETCAVPPGLTLDRVLAFLAVESGRVAVEKNGTIVRKADWPATEVEGGAVLEIVQFVGGG